MAVVGVVLWGGCQGSEIIGIGEFGRPIDAVQDTSRLPRLLIARDQDEDNCDTLVGACTAVCDTKAPVNCEPTDCLPILIDSGSPVTVMPKPDFALRDRCIALRQGHVRSGAGEDSYDPAGTVTRFRFENVPTVDAPEDNAAGWEWNVGVYPDPEFPDATTGRRKIGGVLGGNLLKHFAVRLTEYNEQRSVTFYEQFPGSEFALADQGFAFLRLQYPGRLLGDRVNDRCAFGEGVVCEIDELAVGDNSDDLTFEETRMLLDVCMSPPPCAPLWAPSSATPNENDCELLVSKPLPEDTFLRTCTEAGDPLYGGVGASMIVATGVSGSVLFEDSARRMFGPLEELEACESTEPLSTLARACRMPDAVVLDVPGYPPERELLQLRVRSLGAVAGHNQASAEAPCLRLQKRLVAAKYSCRGLYKYGTPHALDNTPDLTSDDHALVLGESHWVQGQSSPDTQRWLPVTILPAESAIAMNIRREIGTNGVEPDGLLGSSLLDDTDVVLDYTETVEKPGVRVACVKQGDPDCLAYPSCASTDAQLGENAPGRAACCWGLPGDMVKEVLLREGSEAEVCCATLSASSLSEVQAGGACLDVPPPAGIGGIIP